MCRAGPDALGGSAPSHHDPLVDPQASGIHAGNSVRSRGALALGRPELAALVAPIAVFLVVGLALAPDPQYEVRVGLEPPTVIEGQELELGVEVRCVRPADSLEIEAVASSRSPSNHRASSSASKQVRTVT